MVSQQDMLSEFYESSSLMRSDEANMILALLTSLNVVDCNLCVKVRPFPSEYIDKSHTVSTKAKQKNYIILL